MKIDGFKNTPKSTNIDEIKDVKLSDGKSIDITKKGDIIDISGTDITIRLNDKKYLKGNMIQMFL